MHVPALLPPFFASMSHASHLVHPGRLLLLVLALLPLRLHAQEKAAAPSSHPRGEWYHTGYHMALEARPGFRLLEVPESAALERAPRLLAGMGINIKTLAADDVDLLCLGWQDGIRDHPQALTWPEEQVRSILPPELRGFHQFSGDLEDEKKAVAEAEQAVIEKKKRSEEEARMAAEEQKKIFEARKNESFADKAARWKKSVVKVRVTLDDGTAHGSGFFIGPGLIVTNQHVIDGARDVHVVLEHDQSTHTAFIEVSSRKPDVALLRIDMQDNDFLPLGQSGKCRELEEVVMIGYPRYENLSATYVKGSISSTRRFVSGCSCMQLDIPANGGSSGGPVMDASGSVVGILTFGMSGIDPTLAQFVFAQHMDSILPFLRREVPGKFKLAED